MQEQGKTAAWCGRLLLFTAPPAALAPLRTPALPAFLGAGAPAECRETGRWPISGPPRPTLLI
ncbi:hypothetical protein OHS81_26575 [Streptomyces sp. NBC_00400]|uniref:hypothetical protein n=1 Tax=Streptomyces sp. NBC_00400 TaxID=2975737 RepID=UPI002E1B72B6